jgi:glyoxylase I family protein
MTCVIIGFSHVQLVVRDVIRSRQWYAAVLGVVPFVEGDIASGPYAALRHPAGFVIGMQTATPTQAPMLAGGTVDHLSFAVADLAALEAERVRLLAAGIDAGAVFDEAVSHNLRLVDPDGLVVELTAPRLR